MNRYRLVRAPAGWSDTLPFRLHFPETDYGIGDMFDAELTEDEERVNLDSGLLEIMPRRYRVIGASVVHDTPPGDTFDGALPVGIEALLVAGGHIERVEHEPSPPRTTRKTKE